MLPSFAMYFFVFSKGRLIKLLIWFSIFLPFFNFYFSRFCFILLVTISGFMFSSFSYIFLQNSIIFFPPFFFKDNFKSFLHFMIVSSCLPLFLLSIFFHSYFLIQNLSFHLISIVICFFFSLPLFFLFFFFPSSFNPFHFYYISSTFLSVTFYNAFNVPLSFLNIHVLNSFLLISFSLPLFQFFILFLLQLISSFISIL